MTKSASYFISLFVCDYIEEAEGDLELAFQLAASDRDEASKDTEIELAEHNLKGITVGRATFQEFDSGNASHAGAHFEVYVEGIDQEALDKIMQL